VNDLDSYIAINAGLVGAINRRHTPLTDLFNEFVLA